MKSDKKNIAILLLSSLISGVGTGTTLVGINWVLINEFHASRYIGLLLVLGNCLTFITLPLFSHWIDYYDRKRMAIAIRAAGFFVQLSCLLAVENPKIKLSVLFVSGLLSTTLRAFDQVNRTALAQQISTKENYRALNRWLEVVNQVITFLAGGVASLLLVYGAPAVLSLDCSTYALGLIFLIPLKMPQMSFFPPAVPRSTIKFRLESLHYLLKKPEFAKFTLLTLAPHVLIQIQNVIYPAHFSRWLGLGGKEYSMHGVAYASGALLAAAICSNIAPLMGRLTFVRICALFYFLASIMIFTSKNLYATYGCLFTFAFSHASIRIERLTQVMAEVDPQWMGRITGFCLILTQVFAGIGSLLIGYLADQWGVRACWGLIAGASGIFFGCLAIMKLQTGEESIAARSMALH